MSNTAYAGSSYRPHWAGEASNDDIHLEVFDHDIQTVLEHKSLFLSEKLSSYKPLSNSNTYRGDRLSGNFQVKGRSSGERPESTKVQMEKLIIRAETLSYTRIPIDYQDDWTAPDYRKQLASTAGTAHALSYDKAHCIQLLKCAEWEPPSTLAGTFTPVSERLNTLDFTGLSEEEAADLLVQTIKQCVNAFLIEKDISSDELVLLIDPAWFSILLEHRSS